jgi:hypothetical protein
MERLTRVGPVGPVPPETCLDRSQLTAQVCAQGFCAGAACCDPSVLARPQLFWEQWSSHRNQKLESGLLKAGIKLVDIQVLEVLELLFLQSPWRLALELVMRGTHVFSGFHHLVIFPQSDRLDIPSL